MSDSPDDLTPPEIDHTHLPDQTMYKVSHEDASDYEQSGEDIQTYPLYITN
jgi:hypothetical protein